MIIQLIILNDSTSVSPDIALGTKGTHKVNSIQGSFVGIDSTFVKAKFNFEKPNGESVSTDFIEVGEEQTFSYEIPYSILDTEGDILVGVTAETVDGKIFESKGKKYLIYDNVEGLKPIEDKITELELEIEGLEYELSMFPENIRKTVEGTATELTEKDLYGITNIRNDAFKGYTPLKKLTIPESVTTIGTYAFSGATNLEELNYRAASANLTNAYSKPYTFGDCGKNVGGVDVVIGNTTIKVPSTLLNTLGTNVGGTSSFYLKSLAFEDGSICTTIGSYAFAQIGHYAECIDITIPDSVTNISDRAFLGDSSTGGFIKTLTLGRGVQSLGTYYAFGHQSNMEKVVINSVLNLDNYPFNNCTGVKDLYVPWAEGANTYAPWSMTNATIHYKGKRYTLVRKTSNDLEFEFVSPYGISAIYYYTSRSTSSNASSNATNTGLNGENFPSAVCTEVSSTYVEYVDDEGVLQKGYRWTLPACTFASAGNYYLWAKDGDGYVTVEHYISVTT